MQLCGLGARIGQGAPRDLDPRQARGGDERRSALLLAVARLEIGPRGVHQPEVALHVHGEAPVPVVLDHVVVQVQQGPHVRPPPVAEDDVQPPGARFWTRGGHGLGDETLHVRPERQVGPDRVVVDPAGAGRQGADGLELADELVGPLRVAVVVDDDAEAVASQELGHGGAQAGRAGRHEGDEGV